MPKRKILKPMKRITVTVDPDDYAAFDKLARNSEVTASWLIRRSMREFLQRHRNGGTIEVTLGELEQAKAGETY